MKKILLLITICLFFKVCAFGQIEENTKYKINPTKDTNSSTGLYIPKNLDDCFQELEKMLSPELIEEMKSGHEEEMIKYHHGLGTWMRNNWGLWSGSSLSKQFNDLGISHPDNMSGIILASFWRHLNKKPSNLDEQTAYYKYYDKIHQNPPKASFPKTKGDLKEKGGVDYTKNDGKPGFKHVYQDQSTRELWIFELNKGWYKPDKEFINKWNNK